MTRRYNSPVATVGVRRSPTPQFTFCSSFKPLITPFSSVHFHITDTRRTSGRSIGDLLKIITFFSWTRDIFEQVPTHTGGETAQLVQRTRHRLDSPRIESRWKRDFPHPSRPALGPTQPIQWVQHLFRGVKLGRGVDHPHPSSGEVKQRVEL